jgi:hypothetical protein
VSRFDEHIPLADEAFDALERGDLERFTELCGPWTHPQCQFHSGIGSAVGGSSYVGIEGIRSWFADLIATTSERRWKDRRYEPHGDQLLVFLAAFEFTGAGSGAPIAGETAAVFEYEDDLCVRITSFTSFAEARGFAEAAVA